MSSSQTFGIYHGDEEWVLKGIGQDLAKSFSSKFQIQVTTTDQVFKGIRLDVDNHIFVQQGQLNFNCELNQGKVPPNTTCLFTHLDVKNFSPKILSRCKNVIFNSSIQLSMAIANGYDPKNAILFPHGVDPTLHNILPHRDPKILYLIKKLQKRDMRYLQHGAVGFCGRYWEKHTYIRRKNYSMIKEVAYSLADLGIPVIILGPGWEKFFTKPHKLITLVTTEYQNYPLVYNMMRIFVSLSFHEGGPLPVLESMCCGSYPIITNTGFAFDVLHQSVYGDLIAPFRNCRDLTQLILSRYNKNDWDKCALRRHASQFSFDNLAQNILQI